MLTSGGFSRAVKSRGAKLFSAFALTCAAAACAGGSQPAAPVAEAPAPPAAPVFQRADILGAAPDAVDALLGPPALTRREEPGEFRRYALKTCALIVILYPDENGDVAATHVEPSALSAGEDAPDLDACLAAG